MASPSGENDDDIFKTISISHPRPPPSATTLMMASGRFARPMTALSYPNFIAFHVF